MAHSLEVEFRIATDRDREAMLQARAAIYLGDFGHNADDGGDIGSHHLVAVDAANRVVAGFRLLGPEHRPFDFESAFDLSMAVCAGRRPALLGRLFVRPDFRSAAKSAHLLQGLLDLGSQFAQEHNLTDFYIYTFDHLIRFYRRAGFESLGVSLYHEHWRTLYLMRKTIPSLMPVRSPSARQ